MLFKGFINRSESKLCRLQFLELIPMKGVRLVSKNKTRKTNSYLEPSHGKRTILSGIQNLSTDYNTLPLQRNELYYCHSK